VVASKLGIVIPVEPMAVVKLIVPEVSVVNTLLFKVALLPIKLVDVVFVAFMLLIVDVDKLRLEIVELTVNKLLVETVVTVKVVGAVVEVLI
jgi:hypothetical protein